MTCDDRTDQLSALLDGELPADGLADVTRHLTQCPACRQRLAELAGLRAAVAAAIPQTAVSSAFLARVTDALDDEIHREDSMRPRAVKTVLPGRWRLVVSGLAGAAIAAMITLAVLPRHSKTVDLAGVRDASLRTGISLASSQDAGFLLPGYQLIASRADIIAGHRSRVTVYTDGAQTLTLCSWAANGEPAHGVRRAVFRGTAISYWNDGRTEYWAASTGSADRLSAFVTVIRQRS